MIQMRCIKLNELNGAGSDLYGKTTVGKLYTWEEDPTGKGDDGFDCMGGIIDDVDNIHYMPSPLAERDPIDGWATSDYFEVIQETK